MTNFCGSAPAFNFGPLKMTIFSPAISLFNQIDFVLIYCTEKNGICSKTCVKRPLSKRPKIVFQDYHLMQGEHFAILLTFIKLSFVLENLCFVYFCVALLHRFYCNGKFVCVDALCPSQQHLSHVGTFSCLLWLNQCLAQAHNTVPSVSPELATLHSIV